MIDHKQMRYVHGISTKPLPEGHRAVATNFAATRALRRLTGSDTVSEQDSKGNLATKKRTAT